MGNGAISRPENPTRMHVSPSAPSAEFLASQRTGINNGYVANNGAFDHYYHPAGSSGPRMDTTRSQSNGYGSHANHLNYGDNNYWTSGSNSVAPTSYSRLHYGKDPYGKNRLESSHQSPLSVHRKPKKENHGQGTYGRNNYYGNGYENPGSYRGWEVNENRSSNSDEIVFEVFHCVKTGRDYNVINVDGVRYLVNSWDAGTNRNIFNC